MSDSQPSEPTDPTLAAARASLRRQLEKKIEQNRALLAKLESDSKRIPLLGLLLLFAIPGGIYWGFTGVGLVICVTIFCLGSASYLVWGHKEEYRQRIAAANAELRKLS